MRTDLAMESRSQFFQSIGREPDGVDIEEYTLDSVEIIKITVQNETGARAIGKPPGTYITATLEPGWLQAPAWISRASGIVARLIAPLIPPEGPVLVAGLGNRGITPDNLGPSAIDNIVVTRHLLEKMPGELGDMRSVCAISTGVLGLTGIETAEIIKGVCGRVQPCAVIAIDALAARSPNRLCRTFQISDTGIAPGSGAYNTRDVLSQNELGVPVIAVGVPTVIDSRALVADELEKHGVSPASPPHGGSMLVTPKDIDALIFKSAKVIGYAVNIALQGAMSIAEMEQFL